MYQSSQRFTGHLDSLTIPVYSPFLNRNVMVTPRQEALLVLIAKSNRSWTQRALAEKVGYQTPGGVSRSLHLFRRLGLIALSTTRGRFGSTVAWMRRGVRRIWSGTNVAQHHRASDGQDQGKGSIHTVGRVGQHSRRGGRMTGIGDLLAGLGIGGRS